MFLVGYMRHTTIFKLLLKLLEPGGGYAHFGFHYFENIVFNQLRKATVGVTSCEQSSGVGLTQSYSTHESNDGSRPTHTL